MTAVKHSFECPETNRYRRFKLENLLESTNFKLTRFCQATLDPVRHPRGALPPTSRPYPVPAHSRWFDYKRTSQVERAEFPELTDPVFRRKYLRVRNRMVKLFRLYPTQEVTISTLRHMWGGDCKFIQRIHRFLSTCGLINFLGTYFPSNVTADAADARLVQDFAQLVDGPLLDQVASQAPARPLDVACSLCRGSCGDGHFLSRKYPGVIVCPLCFSHQYALDHLEAPHSVFEFRCLPQSKPVSKPADYDAELKALIDSFEQHKGDWTKMAQVPQQCASKSPLDYMIAIIRASLSDLVTGDQLMAHDFHGGDPLTELLEFAQADEDARDPDDVVLQDDWDGLEGEIGLMEDEVRASLLSGDE